MQHHINPDTLLTAIHKHCMECSGYSRKEVEGCLIQRCNLYPYRSMSAMKGAVETPHIRGQVSMFMDIGGMKHE